jgi:hypothetical protein
MANHAVGQDTVVDQTLATTASPTRSAPGHHAAHFSAHDTGDVSWSIPSKTRIDRRNVLSSMV